MNFEYLKQRLTDQGLRIGLQVLGAILLWIVGRMLIRVVTRMLDGVMRRRNVDPTLAQYVSSGVRIVCNVALVIAMFGFFGVETTSFAALLAAAGVAIGMAWSGLLANFAAGVFLLMLKPFKVGDHIAAGGVVGTVRELGLFATVIDTDDGIVTFVGNNKLFADNVQNMSMSKRRRVDVRVQLAYDADAADARTRLLAAVVSLPHVLTEPAPVVEILEVNQLGPVLIVRPFTDDAHYWDVYFAATAAVGRALRAGDFPVVRTVQEEHPIPTARA